MGYLQAILSGHLITPYLRALVVAIGIMIILQVIKKFFIKKLSDLAKKTSSDLDDFVIKLITDTRGLFLAALSIYIGTRLLTLPDVLKETIHLVMVLILLLQMGFWINSLINYLIQKQVQKVSDENSASQATTLSSLGTVAKGVVWAVVVVLALDNIPGIEIGTLIASLGITGIAVGLAVQSILSDLFASLSIALDKPFVIGDSISVGDFTGTIEKVGLKSTRVRSIMGEQLVFSNSDLLSSRIKNYRRMNRRTVILSLGVSYDTPYEKVKAIPHKVEGLIREIKQTTFSRAHLKEFGESALNFEIVYWIESSDYSLFMDIQQQVGLEILKLFGEEGIEFAYPTRTVILEK